MGERYIGRKKKRLEAREVVFGFQAGKARKFQPRDVDYLGNSFLSSGISFTFHPSS